MLYLCNAGVFYCGPSALTHELRQLALDFSHNTSTKYDFHKENFWQDRGIIGDQVKDDVERAKASTLIPIPHHLDDCL